VAGTLDLLSDRESILVVRDVLNAVRRLDCRALEDESWPRLGDRGSGHVVCLRRVGAETGDQVEVRRLSRALRTAPRPGAQS
jgi:hypothetical protein